MGLLDSLRGGVPLVFMAGSREVVELLDYEEKTFLIENKEVTKVRLFLSFAQKFKTKQTGYWYDPILDFDPPLPGKYSTNRIPWEDMTGTVIVCFRSFDGTKKWTDTLIEDYKLRIRTLNNYINNLKRSSIALLRALEGLKDPNVAKGETFHLAEELSALDKLIRKTPELPEMGDSQGQANMNWLSK